MLAFTIVADRAMAIDVLNGPEQLNLQLLLVKSCSVERAVSGDELAWRA